VALVHMTDRCHYFPAYEGHQRPAYIVNGYPCCLPCARILEHVANEWWPHSRGHIVIESLPHTYAEARQSPGAP
jgi:hypothetical protein